MRTILRIINGPNAGQQLIMSPGDEISVGRTERADWAVADDRSLSSRHFLVSVSASSVQLTDLQSTNGTFLNGHPAPQPTELRDQDRIVAGQTIFDVLIEGSVAPPDVKTADKMPPADASPDETCPGEKGNRTTAPLPDDSIFVPKGDSSDSIPADSGNSEPHQDDLDPDVVAMLLGTPPERGDAPSHDFAPPPSAESHSKASSAEDDESRTDVLSRPPAPCVPRSGPAYFETESSGTGLILCRGDTSEIGPGEIASRLAEFSPAYVIVDFNKVSCPPPVQLRTREYLFDWFESNVAEVASPLVVMPADLPDWSSLVDELWGRDAVICLFSHRDKADLLKHLRRSCHPGDSDDQRPGGMVGYCWPSVLTPLLLFSNSDQVAALLDGIDAVLVEFPDLPEAWQVIGRDGLVSTLKQLGLEERTSAIGSSDDAE